MRLQNPGGLEGANSKVEVRQELERVMQELTLLKKALAALATATPATGGGATGGGVDAGLSSAAASILMMLRGEDGEDGIGRPGPAGRDGAQGLAGFPGRDGDDGDDGLAIPGPQGIPGVQGVPGWRGFDGDDGDPGMTIVGPQGPQGVAGQMGFPGRDGEDGEPQLIVIQQEAATGGGGGSGTVTGTGTTGALPIWTDGPGGVLGDSAISDDGSYTVVGGGGPVPLADLSQSVGENATPRWFSQVWSSQFNGGRSGIGPWGANSIGDPAEGPAFVFDAANDYAASAFNVFEWQVVEIMKLAMDGNFALIPGGNHTQDLGSSSLLWNNGYIRFLHTGTLTDTISNYNGLSTAGMGLVPITNVVQLTTQSADIGSTTLVSTAGLYRVSYYLVDTTSAVGAGAVTVTIGWTDAGGAKTAVSSSVLLTGTTSFAQGTVFVQLASGNLTYLTSHTGIFSTAKYALYLSVERIA